MGALSHIRVLDLTRVLAGPWCAQTLADFGADVIKIERPEVGDDTRHWGPPYLKTPEGADTREAAYYLAANRNKRSVTVDIASPEGQRIIRELAAQSDVVLENYSPRVMPQFGLGYERLRELNPGIVYIGVPGFGWSGPSRDWVALGTMIEPAAGLSSLMGYADGGPYKSGVAWADPVAALHAAAAITLALWDRAADPEHRGQAIELAQLEGMIDFIGEEVLAAQVRGADAPRRGNRSPEFAPQGCYRCAGEDRWIAISITSDAEWRSLRTLAGLEASLPNLTLAQRFEQQEAIDAAIGAWTAQHEHIELMHSLQAAGIAAVAVFDAQELVESEHLAARGFYLPITHPDAGTFVFPGFPAHLSATPASCRRPAPGLGEHNREVLGGELGLSDDELAALEAAGVIASEPPA